MRHWRSLYFGEGGSLRQGESEKEGGLHLLLPRGREIGSVRSPLAAAAVGGLQECMPPGIGGAHSLNLKVTKFN